MKKDELFCNTFKALRHELGHIPNAPVLSIVEQSRSDEQKAAEIDIAMLITNNIQ